jgi:ADP-ribosyl-[dinitrogen reductase] hydrolase
MVIIRNISRDDEMTNRETLEELFQTNEIDIRRSGLFDLDPEPLPRSFDFDRIEGMMLGLAIGDALGITTEGTIPHLRHQYFGEIRDYLPNRYVEPGPGKSARGYPSDDTQLAFWTLEQLIEDNGFNPEHVANRFCRDRIFGIGSAVRGFVTAFQRGIEWHRAGQPSAGNGALMRIAPILIPHLTRPSAELWVDTALCAMITHNDTASISACLAFVHILWELLHREQPPEPSWWVREYVTAARELETERSYQPRGGNHRGYQGPISRFVIEKVPKAYDRGLSVMDACNSWYSGAFLLETVPSVLYILMKHGHDFEQAVLRAVNDTQDNDTIAAIVGAAVGALHGRKSIPPGWIENLSGRTTDRDDGRVFELLDQAADRWAVKK